MGNTDTKPHAETALQMQQDLMALRTSSSSTEVKRQAFLRLQAEYAPTLDDQLYSAELSRVYALRYEVWKTTSAANESVLSGKELADRIRGCIFGAALGDAVGLATEFLTRAQVQEAYPDGFEFSPKCQVYPDSHRMMFTSGDWTDDTDQALLILQSLLSTGGKADPVDFAQRLLGWQKHGFKELGDKGGAGLGKTTKSVMSHHAFPTNPSEAAKEVWENNGRKVAPNGAVMRTAVAGIPFFWDGDVVDSNTLAFSTSTHADPRCSASCVAAANVVRHLLLGESIEDAVEKALIRAQQVLEDKEHLADFTKYTSCASLDNLELDDVYQLGYTYKCLGAGLWGLRNAKNLGFKEAVVSIVRVGGDADTNAAVAGALLGTALGFSELPANWVKELTYGVWLEAFVQKLLFMMQLPVVRA